MAIEGTREMLGNIATVLLIKNDCESLKKLISEYCAPIFAIQMMPYMALFCRETTTYEVYLERLEKLGEKIENFITKQFDFEQIDLKEFR